MTSSPGSIAERYRPANLVVVAAGDLQHDEVVEGVGGLERFFSGVDVGARPDREPPDGDSRAQARDRATYRTGASCPRVGAAVTTTIPIAMRCGSPTMSSVVACRVASSKKSARNVVSRTPCTPRRPRIRTAGRCRCTRVRRHGVSPSWSMSSTRSSTSLLEHGHHRRGARGGHRLPHRARCCSGSRTRPVAWRAWVAARSVVNTSSRSRSTSTASDPSPSSDVHRVLHKVLGSPKCFGGRRARSTNPTTSSSEFPDESTGRRH